jgi:hypothetical protein
MSDSETYELENKFNTQILFKLIIVVCSKFLYVHNFVGKQYDLFTN